MMMNSDERSVKYSKAKFQNRNKTEDATLKDA